MIMRFLNQLNRVYVHNDTPLSILAALYKMQPFHFVCIMTQCVYLKVCLHGGASCTFGIMSLPSRHFAVALFGL